MKEILFWCLVALLMASCEWHSPNEGDKIGQVAKVQRAGMICTTTEILVTGKFGGGELHLTVPDKLLEDVKQANNTQAFVKVTYHTDFVNWTCRNATSNQWLDSVEPQTQGAPQ